MLSGRRFLCLAMALHLMGQRSHAGHISKGQEKAGVSSPGLLNDGGRLRISMERNCSLRHGDLFLCKAAECDDHLVNGPAGAQSMVNQLVKVGSELILALVKTISRDNDCA